MCSYIPFPINPVSDGGGSIIWWLVILMLALIALYLSPLYVWSRIFADPRQRMVARSLSLIGSVIAFATFLWMQPPTEVIGATIPLAFLLVVATSIIVVRSKVSVRERITPLIVFFFVLLLAASFIVYFGYSMCGAELFPDYFIERGVSWDELDRRVALLEEGQFMEFTAIGPLACDLCPQGPQGHYVVYRCEDVVFTQTGVRMADDLLVESYRSQWLVNLSYDSDTRIVTIDDSCPLDYVWFG